MKKLNNAASEYARTSTAPDKETPDWIKTDFKAGVKWILNQIDYDDLESDFWGVMMDGDRAKECINRLKKHLNNIVK